MALNNTNNVYISMLYLYAWIFIGNYVLLNLFLVVLLDGKINELKVLEDINIKMIS